MIKSLNISGYRGLKEFSMDNLGKINLIVGNNNSGKTTLLEAIYVLASAGSPSALWKVFSQRGEQMPPEDNIFSPARPPQLEMDVKNFFNGRNINLGTLAKISSDNSEEHFIRLEIAELNLQEYKSMLYLFQNHTETEKDSPYIFPKYNIKISGKPDPLIKRIPLSNRGGILQNTYLNLAGSPQQIGEMISYPVYIGTDSFSIQELTMSFSKIALTPEEDLVYTALRFLEPNIERIAPTNMQYIYYPLPTRGGFKIKIKNLESPIPIGSMGDGIWRLLSLAIALSRSKDNILLIDEIDTGLHYSVMKKMWDFLYKSAMELNVQVFATTHSYDCVNSLASICQNTGDQITIQRVDAGNTKAVPYSEAEIREAVEHDIEMR